MADLHVGGKRLESAWVGEPSEEALVLLHEGLGSVSAWRDFPSLLHAATHSSVFLYSRAGYGQSEPVALPRPLRYMHDEAALLPDVLAAAGISRATLVGHSDGASIAIIAAGSHPALSLRGLVLLAPHVFCEEVSVRAIERARETYPSLRPRLAKYHADVDNAFWGWNGAWLDPAFRAWNIEEYLPAIRSPVLAIQGAEDAYGTLAQLDAIERGCHAPFTRLVIAGAGHALHRDSPSEVIGAITRWLR